MGCNYKIASITIAVLTIVFASLQLTKSCYELRYEKQYHEMYEKAQQHQQQQQQQQHVETAKGFRREGDMMIVTNEIKEDDKIKNKENKVVDEMEKYKQEEYAKWSGKYYAVGRIISIICNAFSIISGLMIYSVVSDDFAKNQRKRHFLIPFIVWHMFCSIMLIVACIYTMIAYQQYMAILAHPLLVTACLVLILVLSVTMVLKYYLSLVRASANSYAQMDEFNETKVPLA